LRAHRCVTSTSAKPGKLKSAILTGNGSGGDGVAPVPPQVIASTCDHSVAGGTLGICSGD